jgi:hypothetical protein
MTLTLRPRILFICLDGDFYLGTFFYRNFVAVFVLQCVLDSDFLIQIVAIFDRNLSLFWFTRCGGGMIFSTVPGRVTLGFSGMETPLSGQRTF